MRTAATAALLAMLGLSAGAALGAPAACLGRFGLDGSPLDLGAGLDPIGLVTVTANGSGTAPSVDLGDPGVFGADSCHAAAVAPVAGLDVFAVRARFEGCGARPRFRVRLRFDAACERAVGRVRAAGQLIASFTAIRVPERRGVDPDGPGDPSSPPRAEPPTDGGTPGDDGTPVGVVTPIGTTPTIASLSPLVTQPGQTISIFGANLDRDEHGVSWLSSGTTPPYSVTFLGVDPVFGRLVATPTFVSPGRIDVRVPSAAVSGTLQLAIRNGMGVGAPIAETSDRLVVVRSAPPPADVPQSGTAPATANRGTLTVQATDLPLFNAGSFPVTGPLQIGAFLDTDGDHVVNLFPSGRDDVPYLAFPERTSEFDFTIEGGRGYFQGANAILWVFFEGGDPSVLDADDQFFVIHLSIDLAHRTARPIAMLAGVAGSPGIVMMADQFASETHIDVAQPGAGVGAISGHLAAVPLFLENVFLPSQPGVCLDDQPFCADTGPSVEQRLWSNGVEIDFDVPLFADNNG